MNQYESFVNDLENDFTCTELINMPLTLTTDMSVTDMSQNSNDHSSQEDQLKELLVQWNLEVVYQACINHQIDLEALRLMNNFHLSILLADYPLGIRVKFEHQVKKYQQSLNDISESHAIGKSPTIDNVRSVSPKRINSSENYIFQIQNVLKRYAQGSLILEYYNKHKVLNESCRNMLVEIVISEIIKKDSTMTLKLANDIADAITGTFPSEIKDLYFSRDFINKTPKGKIYTKYYNTIRSMKQHGLIENLKKEKSVKQLSRTMDRESFVLEIETDSENLATYLLDKDLIWTEVENIWKKTIHFRLNFIKENDPKAIFDKWQHYTKPMGYKLVDIDFQRLYTEHTNFIVAFEKTYNKLIEILTERIKDNASRKLLEKLTTTQDLSTDSKNLIVLYLLHCIFIPTSKKVTLDENGKKNIIKFSIKDSQNSFIIISQTTMDMESTLTKMSNKGPIQPCVLVVGSLLDPKQILIYFDNIKYKMFSALKAFDICFKTFHVFNVEYPLESNDVWLFIQNFYYNIKTKYDKSNVLIKQISSELKI